MRVNHLWTVEERSVIRSDYKHTRASRQDLARRLGVSENAVAGQVSEMGIAKSDDRHAWTIKEKKRLAGLLPRYCVRKVARMMHRSINSITVMAKRIHVSRLCREGWFTKNEVIGILGHDHKWIQRRIDDGCLPATYHYETIPSKNGMSAWHIEETALVNFIRTYPQDLVGCNIDIIMIVELLAGIINNHGDKRG